MSDIWMTTMHYIRMATLLDVVDVLIVAYLLYQVFKLVHGTSVESVIKGVVVLLVIMQLSGWLGLNVINFVLKNTMQVGVVAVLIVFQPELRRILESIGRSNIASILRREAEETDVRKMIREVVDACSAMSWSRTGALIIFEQKNPLDNIITAGTEIDAKVTSELIKNIFFEKAALHDGALVIRAARIKAAGCVLPLSEKEDLPKELGTRHRAGIGITEVSDAIGAIVSEETGVISVVIGGVIRRNLSPEALENWLARELIVKEDEKKDLRNLKNRIRRHVSAGKEQEK